ncbi:uncharacterized protein METZ01_LOCUS337267, partial [marine metagenome]
LKPGQKTTEEELIGFCKENMAKFKRPKKVIFGPMPYTATGKIQKHILRSTFQNNDPADV